MKRKILLIGILVLAVLFLSSCKKTYYATVTIFNDGDILITASVDNDTSLINAGEGVEWTISWEGQRTTQVYLYAEPVGYNDYDENWLTLSGGQDYTWTTGWVFVKGTASKKKTLQ